MSVEVGEIGDAASGSVENERFVEAALTAVQSVGDTDPSLARWSKPLHRAIRRKRLRLPAIAPTTQRVIKLIEAPEVGLDDLAEAVSGDPALAMRLIGVANSSYFRGATEVPNVREALMRMGIREARTIVVVVALRSTLLRSQGLGEAAGELWSHSLLSAAAVQEVTAELPPWESIGFLAGLLHDIGQLVVLSFVAELPAWQEDGAEPSKDDVDAILSQTHAAIGAMLLASWGFPEALCEAVLAHHSPDHAPDEAPDDAPDDATDLARAIHMGHLVARQIEAGWPEDETEWDPSILAMGETLGLGADRIADLAQEAEASFEALSKLS